MGTLDDLRSVIKKKVKGVHVDILENSDIASKREWIATPAYDLNRVLSGDVYKGVQTKTLVGIVGPEHTMKSSFMVLCMAEAQKKGFKPVIIDTEGGITNDFCRRWGLDPKNVLYNYTPWIEEVKTIIAQIKATEDEKFIIGLDSVGGLDRYKSFDDAEKGDPKQDQGLLQKDIRSTLKLLLNICVGQNSLAICTGHMYGSPGHIPMPDQVGGGKAMKLLPTVLISLKKSYIKDSDKKIVGTEITAVTIKNRLYPPFQEATISIDYINGINRCGGLSKFIFDLGLATKAGAWITFSNGDKVQGIAKAEEYINNNSELFLKEINNFLKNTGYSNINKELEEMAEKDKDLATDIPKVDDDSIDDETKSTKKYKRKTKK